MRTTLDIPDVLINELMIETGVSNKTRLISTALKEMLRSIRRKKLIKLGGTFDMDLTENDIAKARETPIRSKLSSK